PYEARPPARFELRISILQSRPSDSGLRSDQTLPTSFPRTICRQHAPNLPRVEAGPGDHDEVHHVEQTAMVLPLRQVQECIDADEEKQTVLGAAQTAFHSVHGCDGVLRPRVPSRGFEQRWDKP